MVDLIYVPGVDSHQLRMKVFPLSFANDAKEWWISEGDGKITTWEELVEKFFCRFYPESYDGEDEMLDEGDTWGIDLLDFLSNANLHTKLTVELADRTVKYPKGIAENVLVRIGKFTFHVDFIILDMPEDIKVTLILRRPFLSNTSAKIDIYKRKITLRVEEEKIVFISVKHASSLIKRVYMLSLRERMELDLEVGLIGEMRIWDNNVGALMNVPIFVGTFSVVTDFAVLEDMDAYRDEGMGDVIFGEPFLREVRIKARRFDGMITIYNGVA
ncbi:putative reverse transcriptase domain-containing protein [Tanacetum coccineum]|uniref:Reverse transcriptase domain-containing protein n=1 Tax=Tanacetum coccineum TaxID=301880 RepID=A0ABQ5BYQ4_9ASTR